MLGISLAGEIAEDRPLALLGVQYVMSDSSMVSPPDSLRVYLARAEVRLGTMHRVAGTLISGAGLLVLLPLFLKDASGKLVVIYTTPAPSLDVWAMLLRAFPAMLAFVIPLVSMYLLLRELVTFYFSANVPAPVGQAGSEPVFHPRFALTAIGLARGEADDRKAIIREYQFSQRLKDFVLPLNRSEKDWLTTLEANSDTGRIALPPDNLPSRSAEITIEDINRLRMAFGLAGDYDRDLNEECAKSELSLIRHNLLLRRLVIRYFKALIVYIWTAIALFGIAAFLNTGWPDLNVAQVGLLVWSSTTPYLVRAPVRWIFLEFDPGAPHGTSDPHLVRLEQFVAWSCLFATLMGIYFLWNTFQHPLLQFFAILGAFLNLAVILKSLHLLPRIMKWI